MTRGHSSTARIASWAIPGLPPPAASTTDLGPPDSSGPSAVRSGRSRHRLRGGRIVTRCHLRSSSLRESVRDSRVTGRGSMSRNRGIGRLRIDGVFYHRTHPAANRTRHDPRPPRLVARRPPPSPPSGSRCMGHPCGVRQRRLRNYPSREPLIGVAGGGLVRLWQGLTPVTLTTVPIPRRDGAAP